MNELSRANKFIYTQLAATAAVTSVVSNRIYARKAPQRATFPFVLYSVQSPGADTQGVGKARILTNPLYQIKIICKDNPDANINTAADAIDDLFQQVTHALQDDVRISTYRQAPLEFTEDTPNSSEVYYHLGGLFRFHIYKNLLCRKKKTNNLVTKQKPKICRKR